MQCANIVPSKLPRISWPTNCLLIPIRSSYRTLTALRLIKFRWKFAMLKELQRLAGLPVSRPENS